MTKYVTLERQITLEPEFLGEFFKKNLWEKMKKTYTDTVNIDTGYILSVSRTMKIIDNKISNVNSDIIFTVQFQAEVLKPEINQVIEGVVMMVYNCGIFLNIRDKFNVLIPIKILQDNFVFNQTTKIFDHKTDVGLSISKDQKLEVKITGLRFSKQNFSCYGILVD